MLTANLLKQVFPLCADPARWVQALNPALEQYQINTRARLSSFLAQNGYESNQFNRLVESLNHTTPLRLIKVWPKRFPTLASAVSCVGNASRLANFVYANRLGNGDSTSGDGFKFRGRGIIQITGRSNYAAAGQEISVNLIEAPDRLLTPTTAALAAAWFWNNRGLNALADDKTGDDDLEDFTEITRRVNGGTTGINQRLLAFNMIEARFAQG